MGAVDPQGARATPKGAAGKAAAAQPAAPAKAQRNRYAVRRSDGTVLIWTEALGVRKDFEEVFAASPAEALETDALPDPRNITLHELEALAKDKLILFAATKLDLKLDAMKAKKDLLLDVKEAIFSLPPLGEPEVVTVEVTKAMQPQQARTQAGV